MTVKIILFLEIKQFRLNQTMFPLTLYKISLFGAAHGWWDKKAPLPKSCQTHTTVMKLGTVILYVKNIQRSYISRDTPLEFC